MVSKALLSSLIVMGGLVSTGGIWVGTIQGQVSDNSTHIEELEPVIETVIRMDERQISMKETLDRIEDALKQ